MSYANVIIEKPTVLNLFKTIPSGIGLDIAKNHSGITIWNGETIETYGFSIDEYSKDDYFAEYRMRKQFKEKLTNIVCGRHFEYCVIEDVYGGENFDTTRKLLALQTVIDELIFSRICTVGEFYRWNEPKWSKYTRMFYKQKGKLKSKVETQGILDFLEFDFYKEHCEDKPAKKREIFFEDICDSCAILLSVVAYKKLQLNIAQSSSLKLSDIKMYYIEDIMDTYGFKDRRIAEEAYILADINTRNIEKDILLLAGMYPNDVICVELPVDKLGNFGLKHGFKFYSSGEGYLFFYKK